MLVKELAHSPAATCTGTTTIAEAAKSMHVHDVGSLVLVDEAGQITGVVTDRDLAVKGYARELPPGTPVSAIATQAPLTISADADIDDATSRMMSYGIRRLPVTDADGHLFGVISLDDLTLEVEAQGDKLRRALEAQIREGVGGWNDWG